MLFELLELLLLLDRFVDLDFPLLRLDLPEREFFDPFVEVEVLVVLLFIRGKSSFKLKTKRFGPHALGGGTFACDIDPNLESTEDAQSVISFL